MKCNLPVLYAILPQKNLNLNNLTIYQKMTLKLYKNKINHIFYKVYNKFNCIFYKDLGLK